MKPKFYRKVLKNGMTIILEKRDIPVVAVGFAVRCGGINESREEKGISHFIEHMLYKGTKNRDAKQISEEIEKNGGILNGFTDEIITAYWCKMPSKKLDVALDVLSDMVKNPIFDEKEMDKERKVIFEEIKMRKDNPRIYVQDKIQSCLYDSPLGDDLIGTYATMSKIDRKKMIKRFNEVYKPNNMLLCVVGDADFDKLVDFSQKNFGNEKGSVPNYKVKEKNEVKIEKRKGVDQANLIFSFHAPKVGDKKSHAAELLITLMAQGLSSRLFHEIREKRNLAYSVSGSTSITKKYSHAEIYVGTSKDNVEKVKKLILEEFEKVSNDLGEKELNQVKEQMIGIQQVSLEDSAMRMMHVLYEEVNGDIDELINFEKNIRAVKLKDVKELAKIKRYSFFALVPG